MMSEETKRKLSETHKRLGSRPPSRKGIVSPMKGITLSADRRKTISDSLKKVHKEKPWVYANDKHQGMLGKVQSKETRSKISEAHKGMKYGQETKDKIRNFLKGRKRPDLSGEKHYNWKGGITPVNEAIRKSLEYRIWREAVFVRDNYTCVWCNRKGGVLHADHIKRFADYPELRFAIDNGRTLCEKCHRTTETYGNRK